MCKGRHSSVGLSVRSLAGVLTSPFLYEEGHQSASLSSHQSALPVSLSVCWCCVLVCQHSPRQPAVRGVGPRRAVIGQPCVPALARRCTTRQGPPPRVEGSPRLAAVCTPAPAPAIPGVTCTCLRSRAAAADVGGVVVLCVAAGGLGSLPRGSWPSPFCFPTLHPPFGHASPATACVCAVCSPVLLVIALRPCPVGRGAAMCCVDRPRAAPP